MDINEIFQKIFESELTDQELKIFESLEESFADVTPENSSDYIKIEKYFEWIRSLFPDKQFIDSHDIKSYIKQSLRNDSILDLLFLDGLDSLAFCLSEYGEKDDLQFFENWFSKKIKSIKD